MRNKVIEYLEIILGNLFGLHIKQALATQQESVPLHS